MKGILLAGGRATRLYPITKGICKQLLPVYDKPMVYYPLSVLMLAGIRDILLISTPVALPRFQGLLGDGSDYGLRISYAPQQEPRGIADAFLVAEGFIGTDNVCLVLGDNIFYGHDLTELLRSAASLREGAVIFAHFVRDPGRYGVIEFDRDRRVVSIEEKPEQPRSHWVSTGLYFYDNQVTAIAKRLTPSRRNELEITDINNEYARRGLLDMKLLGRGYTWLDTGTFDSLMDASAFIRTIEERQGLKVGCIEEIAYRMGYISRDKLCRLADSLADGYGTYLMRIVKDEP